jgi:CRISPR-associated protein Cas1
MRNEDVNMIHLSEINTILIDSMQVSITTSLICELINRKIKLIFCDETHNPKGEIVPYYGSHHTSKKILSQVGWEQGLKDHVWKEIVIQKIRHQSKLLKKIEKENYVKLESYLTEVELADKTNREGHAAKVYFNSLFGKNFTRDENISINHALDYGYSILLSNFNKEIVSNGYLTQLGLHHKNEFNYFNLSSDLMEPFRILIDQIVYQNVDSPFDSELKMKLINVLNQKVKVDKNEQFVTNAISIYCKGIFKVMDTTAIDEFCNLELI